MFRPRVWTWGLLLASLAGCGGACGTSTGPIPGGFDDGRKIVRAAQARLTNSGLDALAETLSFEARRGLGIQCSASTDCPAGFLDSTGLAISPECRRGRCAEAGADAPYLAVEIPAGARGGVELCPSGGSCQAIARFGGFTWGPRSAGPLNARFDLQVAADVSVKVGDADCLVTLRPPPTPTPAEALLELGVHASSRAVTLGFGGLGLGLSPNEITVSADPRLGDANDAALCAAQTTGAAAVTGAIEAALTPALERAVAGAFGWSCAGPTDCPSAASCEPSSRLCIEDGTGHVLGNPLPYETRLLLPALLGELGYRGTSGLVDAAFSVGGAVDSDALGLDIGILAGLETPQPNPTCAAVTDSPVVRPGFIAPSGLMPSDQADLDWDGLPDTPYDVAFGASQGLLRQVAWGVYNSGLFCGVVTRKELSELTTGTLELIIPSVRFLTRSDLSERAEAPARLSIYAKSEPRVVVGSGEIEVFAGENQWREALLRLDLRDVELNLSVLVDERYLRILTVTLDLHLGIGAVVKPNNAVEPILGVGVPALVSNVRVTNSELLSEDPASLSLTIPTLVSLLVLDLSGSQGEIDLPDLPGLYLSILGIRGEDGQSGTKENVVVYANARPVSTANLRPAAETEMVVHSVETPATEAFAVTHPGGPIVPSVQLALSGKAPVGDRLEYQVRLDGGPWSPFFRKPEYTLQSPQLLLQGEHEVEARARIVGDYTTLDPTPATAAFVVDSVAPELTASIARNGESLEIDAWDRVGPVALTLRSAAGEREVPEGIIALAEDERQGALTVVATDAAGNERVLTLRAGDPQRGGAETSPSESGATPAGGCRGVPGGAGSFLALLMGLGALRRRSR